MFVELECSSKKNELCKYNFKKLVMSKFNPADNIQDLQYFGEYGGVNPSITDSSTYTFLRAGTMEGVFEGEVEYDFIKIPTKIKDINFKMQQVNIQKILHFFKEKGYLFGLADIDGKFNSLEKYKKEGAVKIHMDSASMPKILPNISFSLDSVIDFNGL